MRYSQIKDGEWFMPVHRKHKEMCCDCGLVHTTDYKVDEKGNIWIRSTQDPKATASARKRIDHIKLSAQDIKNKAKNKE